MTTQHGSGARAQARRRGGVPGTSQEQRAAGTVRCGPARSAAAIASCLWALCLWLAMAAGPIGPALAEGRYAAMLVDANTGQVLHAEAADEPRYPASLTKMMTLYLVFEQLQQGRLKPDTRITISPEAASTSPSKLGLEPGASITVADAVKALITKSANDIAVALAEHIAGDEARFADLMTRRARDLGMAATTFRNPHGLPDRGQVTTARDMLTLSLRLYDTFPSYARLFATRSFHYAGRTHRNHNSMLDSFAGMEGIKTGYTSASGYNLVASVRRDGKHVIAAVFGGASAAARNARMRVILTRGLQSASTEHTRKPLIIAGRAAPAPVAAKRPVPHRVASAAAPVAKEPAPALVEPVSAVVRSREPEPRPRGGDWRSTVRIAAPVGGGASVASSLGGDWRAMVRQPSTLEAQAAEMSARAASPAPAPTARVAVAPRQGSQGSAQVQIGAFAQVSEARLKLEATRSLVAGLQGAGMSTPTVSVNGRTLYRARFTGLDPAAAAAACSELRRKQVDCLVAQAE